MNKFAFRILNLLIGILLYALGIVLVIKANIGYAPWEVFHAGFSIQTGLGIGAVSIVTGIVILIIVTLNKEKFGLGTIASMILTGVFIDLIIYLSIIPVSGSLVIGIPMLIGGLFIIAAGSYFYIKSAFGAGPRDNLMVVLGRKTKLPIGVCRGIVELAATLIGWLLGGMVGIGTVIAGFTIGFCVQIVFAAFKFDATAVQHETLKQTIDGLFEKS